MAFFIKPHVPLISDNACEYFSRSLTTFIKSHGILHQTSCTSHQNGEAECKNRHPVETTHTILIYGDVLQRFLGDVVLSACYLINRMSSSVLENKIPHSILFLHEPFHHLPLKVFGSTFSVYNFCPDLDKLSARSHNKCVFYGSLDLKNDINISHPLLTVISFRHMSLSLSLYFKFLSSPMSTSD